MSSLSLRRSFSDRPACTQSRRDVWRSRLERATRGSAGGTRKHRMAPKPCLDRGRQDATDTMNSAETGRVCFGME
jgi:hypothetical protein